jgi:curved DNA-binding protein CbpA
MQGRAMLPLSGDIQGFVVPWLFQEMRVTGRTGTVTFEREGAVKKAYIASGEIIFAVSNQDDDQLGALFVQAGKLTQEQNAAVRELAGKSGKSIGGVLVERGYVKTQDLVEGAKLQVKRIIAGLFSWIDGRYQIALGPLPVAELVPLQIETGRLVAESLQGLDWKQIRKSLPSLKTALRKEKDLTALLHGIQLDKDQKAVLDLIDNNNRSIEELCALSGLGDFNTLKAVHMLLGLRLAEIGGEKTAAEVKQDMVRAAVDAASGSDKQLTREMIMKAHEVLETQDYYEILDIGRSAEKQEIRKAYFRLAKIYHPDRHMDSEFADLKPQLEDLFRGLNEAYTTLNSAEHRERYNLELANGTLSKKKADKQREEHDTKTGSAIMQFQTGIKHYRSQNFWGAEESFRWATRLDAKNAEYSYYLGLALAHLPRRGNEAEEYFTRAIELDPSKVDYYLDLGNLYARTGLATKALDILRKAQVQDPNSEKIRSAIQRVSSGAGAHEHSP